MALFFLLAEVSELQCDFVRGSKTEKGEFYSQAQKSAFFSGLLTKKGLA